MCGRFSRFLGQDVIERRYNIDETTIDIPISYNIAPSQDVAVIIQKNPLILTTMRWGFIPFWAKNVEIGYKMINTRSETIMNKSFFKSALENHRCLIPVTGFYEWKTNKSSYPSKVPYHIQLKSEEIFSLAGIYSNWRNNNNPDQSISSFSIITTGPNEIMEPIHDRMPVIIKRSNENDWINPKTPISNLLEFLIPYESGNMKAYPVSNLVNSPNNDSIACIIEKSIEIQRDTSLDDFFN